MHVLVDVDVHVHVQPVCMLPHLSPLTATGAVVTCAVDCSVNKISSLRVRVSVLGGG